MDSNVQVIFTILPVQSKVCGLTVQEMGSQDPVAVWKSLKAYGEGSFFIWGEAELQQRAAAREGAGGAAETRFHTASAAGLWCPWPLWWQQVTSICTGSPKQRLGDKCLGPICTPHLLSCLLIITKPLPSSHSAKLV